MSKYEEFIAAFEKELSPNDLGVTASHQAGLLIPWKIAKLSYFPTLEEEVLNPRRVIRFEALHDNSEVDCNFIFYNNKLVGTGTRREYRITGIRKALKSANAQVGDTLVFGKRKDTGGYAFEVEKRVVIKDSLSSLSTINLGPEAIKLEGGWKVIGKWEQ
jgi:hypothetical protein